MISTNETNFLHFEGFYRAFANNSLMKINWTNTQIAKIRKSDGFIGRTLGTLGNIGLQLTSNVLIPWVKDVLITLRLKAPIKK